MILTRLGDERIQTIVDGDIVYIEEEKSEIDRIMEMYYAHKTKPSTKFQEEMEDIMSNVPRPFVGDFKKDKHGTIYFRNYKEPVGEGLLEKLQVAKERNDYELIKSLENFQALVMLNVNEQARQDLYSFIQHNSIAITPKGYFVGYKAVRPTMPSLSLELQGYLSKIRHTHSSDDYLYQIRTEENDWTYEIVNSYIAKPLKGQARAPRLFLDRPEVLQYREVGEFRELYSRLETLQTGIYVDKHSGSIKQKKGDIVKMARQECDSNPQNDCSYGLHVGNSDYVNSFGYGTDVILHCLVNPADVIAVPSYDVNKMRVCQYFISGFSPLNDDGTIETPDNILFEHDYAEKEREQIEKELAEGNFDKYIDNRVSSIDAEQAQEIVNQRKQLIA